jgi:4a-hydroxytetrahydrobiopterin dehydratase
MKDDRPADDMTANLTGTEASDAISHLGWRFLLGALQTAVPVTSFSAAVEVAAKVTQAAGPQADDCLQLDLRPDRAILTLMSRTTAGTTRREIELAERLAAVIEQSGYRAIPATDAVQPRSLQTLEMAIDALDIPAIRPFWKAAMAYVDEPGHDGPTDPLVDPLRQGPAIWFQQMSEPRPQRNRIHFDLCVPHDEALPRLESAIAAGGILVSKARAPAFWILADAEGNEVCITTWQGRD